MRILTKDNDWGRAPHHPLLHFRRTITHRRASVTPPPPPPPPRPQRYNLVQYKTFHCTGGLSLVICTNGKAPVWCAKYKVTLQCAAVGYSLVEQIIQGLLFRELSLWLSPGGARIHAPCPRCGGGEEQWKDQHSYLQVKSGNTLECDGHTQRNLPMGGW